MMSDGQTTIKETSVPFTIVLPTIYGQMLVNRYDINQTNALFKTGKSVDYLDIQIILQLLTLIAEDDPIVLDVGANIGTHTLAIAQFLNGKGRIYAIEAQRILYYLLCGSVALNSHRNVHVLHAAAGQESGFLPIPQFDYSKPMNFGSIEFSKQQKEVIEQERSQDREDEVVPVITLDSLNLKKLALLKIDVEGMEMEVLRGAHQTIMECQPIIFIETLKVDKGELASELQRSSYDVHESGINFMCIPEKYKARIIVRRNDDAAPRDGETS